MPEFIVIDQIMVSKTMIAMIEPGGTPTNVVEHLVAIEAPKNDPNKTEAIRAFIKTHIRTDKAKLKDETYKKEWVDNYERM